jgi:hypothetical protein
VGAEGLSEATNAPRGVDFFLCADAKRVRFSAHLGLKKGRCDAETVCLRLFVPLFPRNSISSAPQLVPRTNIYPFNSQPIIASEKLLPNHQGRWSSGMILA